MKNHIFLMDALTEVDDNLIAEAEIIRPKRPWKSWVAAAAALAIIVSAAFYLPATSSDPITPNINTYVQTFITRPAHLYEQGYVGNPYNEKTPNGSFQSVLSPYRMALTAKVFEILPDTYQMVGQQQGGFRLVRMSFIRALNTGYEGQYFYCIISDDQAATLNVFSTVVLTRMKQYGHSNHVLYNITKGCLSAIDFPLIGGGDIFAFRYGLLDYSFPGTAEYIEEQNQYFEYRKCHLSNPSTLEEFEMYLCGTSVGEPSEMICDNTKYDNQEIADALDYVRPFENGIFVPLIDPPLWRYRNEDVMYRRYVNGYPTNEAILISPEGVKKYGQTFTDDDLIDLPNLSSALQKVSQDFNAGLITPGHIQNWEDMKFISHSIFGWYDKTNEGVYGIIRVSWCYHDKTNEDRPTRICNDDQYFLIEMGSDTLRPIEHDELLEMGGGAYHFMPGQYGYDEYGRKSPPYFFYY